MNAAEGAIKALRRRNPHAVRLAQAVSFAVVVDRALLRAARLELVPEADAGAEADLWFSSIVTSRTVDGIVLDREAAETLRRAMRADEVEAAWRVTSREHEPWVAPSIRFEEEIAYLSVSAVPGARERMAAQIQSVVRAMLRQDRPGLAQWASRALAMFPSDVRDLPETKMLDAGARIRLGHGVATAEDEPMPSWMSLVAPPSLARARLKVELRERELILVAPAEQQRPSRDAGQIEVPATNPIVVEVSWDEETVPRAKQVVLRPGETVRLAVANDALRIRTITGEEFDIREAAVTSDILASEIIDFSAELARHGRVVGRERELAELMMRTGMVRIDGEEGVGKTALLCELVRRLAPAPVFVHFFRSGDYRMGSISAAMRSIAAQIALRYRLEETVVELPLHQVLERLALSPRCPSQLYIVLDDVDDARDEKREVPDRVLERMFEHLPAFVTVFASSASGRAKRGPRVSKRGRDWALGEEVERFDLPEPVLRVAPSKTLVAEVYGDEIAEQSVGNFGDAEAFAAAERLDRRSADGRELLHRLPERDAAALIELSVAKWPLPAELFGELTIAETLIRHEGGQLELLAGLRRLIEGTDDDATERTAELMKRLEANLDREDVRRYYALHALDHLLAAGKPADARALCRTPAFMKEVLAHYEPALMLAHLEKMSLEYEDDTLRATATAFEREAEALAVAPAELPAILAAYLPEDVLPHPAPRLVTIGGFVRDDRLPPRRHEAPIAGCAAATDGTLASWSDDGRLILREDRIAPVVLDLSTPVTAWIEVRGSRVVTDAAGFLHVLLRGGVLTSAVAAHAGPVSGAVAGTGELFATWSAEGVIRLWSVVQLGSGIEAQGELVAHEHDITGCAFVGGDRLLVSCSRDGTIRTWSIAEKRAIQVIRNGAPVTGMVVSSDGRWIAAVDDAGQLRIDAVEPRLESSVSARNITTQHRGGIEGIALSSDDRFLATWGGASDGVCVWQVPPASSAGLLEIDTFLETPRDAQVTACTFLEPGPRLLIARSDGSAIVAELEPMRDKPRTLDSGGVVIRSALDLRETFLTGDESGRLIEWNEADFGMRDYSKAPGRIDAMVAGEAVLVTDGESYVRFLESEAMARLRPLRQPRMRARGHSCVIWSTLDSQVLRGDVGDRTLETVWEKKEGEIATCAIGRDPSRIAIGYTNGVMRILHGSSASESALGDSEAPVTALAFASDDSLLVSAHEELLTLWDVSSGSTYSGAMADEDTTIVAIEPDDERNRIATVAANGTIRIRPLDNLPSALTLEGKLVPALGCWFTSDGTALVGITADHTIRIWSTETGNQLAEGRGHRAPITGLVLANHAIYTCSEDRTVRMWDARTGEQLAVVYGYNAFRCIAASEAGVITAGDDAGQVWQLKTGDRESWFISAAADDRAFVEKLRSDLQNRGIDVWSTTASGVFLTEALRDAVRQASGAIVILSEAAGRSSSVQYETVAFASSAKVPVVAVVIDDTDPFESQFAFSYERLDFRRWRDPYTYEDLVAALVDRLSAPPSAGKRDI